jgi:hypothetical protein
MMCQKDIEQVRPGTPFAALQQEAAVFDAASQQRPEGDGVAGGEAGRHRDGR